MVQSDIGECQRLCSAVRRDGSRFQHQLVVGARYQIGKFVPGIFYMKNFNDLGDIVPDAVAIELSMTL